MTCQLLPGLTFLLCMPIVHVVSFQAACIQPGVALDLDTAEVLSSLDRMLPIVRDGSSVSKWQNVSQYKTYTYCLLSAVRWEGINVCECASEVTLLVIWAAFACSLHDWCRQCFCEALERHYRKHIDKIKTWHFPGLQLLHVPIDF